MAESRPARCYTRAEARIPLEGYRGRDRADMADTADTAEQEPFKRVDVQKADGLRRQGVPIIDCREADEYADGHVQGAPLIPHMSVFTRADEVERIAGGKEKPVMFICAKGQRSAVACEFAAAAGFSDLSNIEGGTDAWIEAGLPIEK